jgi:hypothetical protein
MSKSKNFMQAIDEMGRHREEMISKLEALDMTLQDHFWKLFTYHQIRPDNVKGWLTSINKHLDPLQRFNKGKEAKYNFNKEELHDKMSDAWFGTMGDVDLLTTQFARKGYPVINITEEDRQRLIALVDKYIDYILNKDLGLFKIKKEELL